MCAPVTTVCLALINPLPIGHDMFISLLPVCIVNAKPQPALQRVGQRVLLCVDVHGARKTNALSCWKAEDARYIQR